VKNIKEAIVNQHHQLSPQCTSTVCVECLRVYRNMSFDGIFLLLALHRSAVVYYNYTEQKNIIICDIQLKDVGNNNPSMSCVVFVVDF